MDIQRVKTFVAINLITIIRQLLHKKFQIGNIGFRPMLLQRKSKSHFNNLFQFMKNNNDK